MLISFSGTTTMMMVLMTLAVESEGWMEQVLAAPPAGQGSSKQNGRAPKRFHLFVFLILDGTCLACGVFKNQKA